MDKFETNQENEEKNVHLQYDSYKLCSDSVFDGLDRYASQTWIYPINLPLRQYQFDIVQTALFHNTLVSLPTGLGKTFIAAVVMYNIYRWYPLCRVIFMAPTRPLVTQQADACQNITGIPIEDIAEFTGKVQSTRRKDIWNKARVFFLTPQILYRDLQAGICPAHLIRCLVIDEAHKTSGKHAYCEVMRSLENVATRIRVLALSATPGATPVKVGEVVRILKIARFEIRTENSSDVTPYIFNKSIETVIVRLGEPLSTIREEYIMILDFYARRLMKSGLLKGSPKNFHKGRIFLVQKNYIAQCKQNKQHPDPTLLQDLSFCLTLYHAYDILVKHGLRSFSSFFEEHGEKKHGKAWLMKNEKLVNLLVRIRKHLDKKPLVIDSLPNGTIAEVPKDIIFGHPKYLKLRDVVETHLKNVPDSRVMVFCEYKETVSEAFGALLSCRPIVRPCMFLGQRSLAQKQQLKIVKQFELGEINTLVCTCVAEEGLDFTSVNLIVCFDIANRSPIRLTQRMGRTGRHQAGKIIMLVTEGREYQILSESIQQSSVLDSKLLESPEVKSSLLPSGPSILPNFIIPQCIQMHITLQDKLPKTDTRKKKQKKKSCESIKQFYDTEMSDKYCLSNKFHQIKRINLDSGKSLSNKTKDTLLKNSTSNQSNSSDRFDYYSSFRYKAVEPVIVGNSDDTLLLQSLFKKADELKFNLSSRKLPKIIRTKNQDIRNLFVKSTQSLKDEADFAPVMRMKDAKSQKESKILMKKVAVLKNIHYELNVRKFIEPSLIPPKINIIFKDLIDNNTLHKFQKDANKIDFKFAQDEEVLKILTNENINNLNVYDLITLNYNAINSEISDLQDTSFNNMSWTEEQTSITENENSTKVCSFNEDLYFDDSSLDYNLTNELLETCNINHSIIESNNKCILEDIARTMNPSPNSQTTIKSSNINDCIISSNTNFKNSFSVSESSEQDTKLILNKSISHSLSNTSMKCKPSNEFDSTSKDNNVESNIKKPEILFDKQKRNFVPYIPDEKSQKALEFFGLSCIEDLFIETNDTFVNNLFTPKSNNKINWCTSTETRRIEKTVDDQVIDLCTFKNKSEMTLINNKPISPVISNLNRHDSDKDVHTAKNCSPAPLISSIKPNIVDNKDNFDLWDDTLFASITSDEENFLSNIEQNAEFCKKVNNNESISDINISMHKESKISSKGNSSVNEQLENDCYNDDDSDLITVDEVLAALNENSISTYSTSKSPILNSQKKRKSRTRVTLGSKDKNSSSLEHIEQISEDTNDRLSIICTQENSSSLEHIKQISEDTNDRLSIVCTQENKRNLFTIKASEAYANKGYNFENYESSLGQFSSTAVQNFISYDGRTNCENSQKKNKPLSKTQLMEAKAYAEKGYDFMYCSSEEDMFSDDESLQMNNVLSPKPDLPSEQLITNQSTFTVCKQQTKKRKRCKFINDEAEVTDDESNDTEEFDDDLNDSFVVQDTELNSNSKMHAHYLKSIRSPSKRLKLNAFKIPQLPTMRINDVCSQQDWQHDNTYELDSFCIDTAVTETENNSELSFLELAEKKLEREYKIRKRKRALTKIKQYSSSSDDEDMKALREECLQNKTIVK